MLSRSPVVYSESVATREKKKTASRNGESGCNESLNGLRLSHTGKMSKKRGEDSAWEGARNSLSTPNYP